MPRILPILLVLLLLCPSSVFAVTKSRAKSGAAVSAQVTHKVKKGDTLSEIAKKVGVPANELKRLNNLSGNKIKPGQVLVVKNGKKKPAAATKQATHEVKKGDSLYEIAKKVHVSVDELKRLNNLKSNNLKLGQVLIVGKKPASVEKSAVAKNDSGAHNVGATHQVKKGDTLSKIAKKVGISENELKRLNNLSGNKIKPGQVLVVKNGKKEPVAGAMKQVTHKVKKGDSLYEIAKKVGVSVGELKRLNNLRNNDLKLGQILVVAKKPAAAEKPVVTKESPDEQLVVEARAAEKRVIEKELTRDFSRENASLFEKTALSFLDTPYRFGGTSEKGIDCSGFVQKVFKEFNFKLPRSAREQYTLGTKVPKGDLQTGDLVFFRTYAKYPSHVGIYLGDNKMIHASTRNRGVVVSSINSNYFRKRYIGAKRLAFNHEGLKLDGIFENVQEDAAEDSEDGPEEGTAIAEGNG